MQRIDKIFLIEDEDEYEEVEDDDNEDDGDGNDDGTEDEDSTDQQSHQDHQFSRILNENSTGMRIYTTIPKIHKHKYFKVRLNAGKKVHSQTNSGVVFDQQN